MLACFALRTLRSLWPCGTCFTLPPLRSGRAFAWISRNRRLARDFERYAATVAAFVRLAMIRIMLRRLAVNPLS